MPRGNAPDPWLGAGLSMLAPGLGQLHAGRPWRGAAWLVGALASTAGFLWWVLDPVRASPWEGGAWIAGMAFSEIGSWWDAIALGRAASGREPDARLAFMLSGILPGFGQWAAGRRVRGIFWLAAIGALLGVAGWMLLGALDDLAVLRARRLPLAAVLLVLLGALLWCWSEAARLARRPGRDVAQSPEAALMLTVLFPGLGQLYLYASRWWLWLVLGPVLLIPGVFLMLVDTLEPGMVSGWPGWLSRWPWGASAAAGMGLSVAAAVHAWVAGCRRAGRPTRLPGLTRPLWALALAAWLVAELPWQGWLKERVRSFRIPSSSMEPTLLVGDRLWAMRVPVLARGDVVVFEPPGEVDVDYIKRVVGLPGETVLVRDKVVFVNGRRMAEPFTVHRDHVTGYPVRDRFGPLKVPPGCYFVMGDNRDFSKDSRYFGVVAFERVYGRAYKLFWPPARCGPLGSPTER